MIVQTIPISAPQTLFPDPLTRETFHPFGEVITNPRPSARPFNTSPSAIARGDLPCGAVSANQGTAIQYRAIASMRNLYNTDNTRKPGTPRMTMFVCAARAPAPGSSSNSSNSSSSTSLNKPIPIQILERHPFTTQTFIPLTASTGKAYLVIVAPSLPPSKQDEGLPVPSGHGQLPGRGLPDLSRLRAFIATGEQAVTYGPGTWHAPMVALGPANSTVDFVVVQHANDTPLDDCQEVTLEGGAAGRGGIVVKVPETLELAKL